MSDANIRDLWKRIERVLEEHDSASASYEAWLTSIAERLKAGRFQISDYSHLRIEPADVSNQESE